MDVRVHLRKHTHTLLCIKTVFGEKIERREASVGEEDSKEVAGVRVGGTVHIGCHHGDKHELHSRKVQKCKCLKLFLRKYFRVFSKTFSIAFDCADLIY